jgi:hypothetical protein
MVKEWLERLTAVRNGSKTPGTRLEALSAKLEGGCPMHGDRKKNLIALMVLLVALSVVAVAAYWRLSKPERGPYGAIAMSDSSLTYGGAWGYADPMDAYKRSIAECTKAGSHDCVVKVSLKDSCGALAISAQNNASYLVTGKDQVKTTELAMAQCQATGAADCQVRENFCSSSESTGSDS